jgi:hypothetical protein
MTTEILIKGKLDDDLDEGEFGEVIVGVRDEGDSDMISITVEDQRVYILPEDLLSAAAKINCNR